MFFDGQLVHELDQQSAPTTLSALPEVWLGEVLSGEHVLSFRLDTFDTLQSVIEISNIQTGLMELVANRLPSANAGTNATARVGSVVTLNGTASVDQDNAPSPLNYAWSKTAGPAVNFFGSAGATANFTPTVAGTYVFSLVVNDGLNDSQPASVTVTVPILGDIDGDSDVDNNDLSRITSALNTKASGPNDLRDLNGDGKIDALDSRILVTRCTRARCASQ